MIHAFEQAGFFYWFHVGFFVDDADDLFGAFFVGAKSAGFLVALRRLVA